MEQYGCFGSILSRDADRASCSGCNEFEDCGTECERIRQVLVDKWELSAEITKFDHMMTRLKGEVVIEALDEIVEVWEVDDNATEYEKMKMVSARCNSAAASRVTERWYQAGVDTQIIRKGENPFNKNYDSMIFIFAEELLKRGVIDDDFRAEITRQSGVSPAAALANIRMSTSALYAASVLEKRDGVYTLRGSS